MAWPRPPLSDRLKAGIGTLLLEASIGLALIAGIGVRISPSPPPDALKVFRLLPQQEPPPRRTVVPPSRRSKLAEGAASPPNIRSKPTDIVAPPPPVPMPVPPPVVTAPVAGPGTAATAGAAPVVGPGTGSGGIGNGSGSGGSGTGEGGGGRAAFGPRWLHGRLKDSDYPRDAGREGIGGTVVIRYTVGVDGRISGCTVMQSSGSEELDTTTCSLVTKRFRYEPARDAFGRPVPSRVEDSHEWVIDPVPPDPAPDGSDRR